MEQEITVQKTKESSQTALCIMAGNLLISAVFLASGLLGKSIAAVSEGIDSLTDAVSSLLLLLGFKIASREPDSLHPYGHQRFEYIIGLFLSELILFAAFSLGKKSIELLLHPETTPLSLLLILASVFGIAGKLLIYLYINKKNRTLKSISLETYSKNTLADLKGILFIMISAAIQHVTSFPADAAAGLIIAALICIDGLKSFFKNISLLIGEGDDHLSKRKRSSYANQ